MVDKGMGFLLVLVHFILTVTSLWKEIERVKAFSEGLRALERKSMSLVGKHCQGET